MKDSPPPSTPTESAPAEQVLVLPGHLFFIETIEVPIDLEAAEIQDFVELILEKYYQMFWWTILYAYTCIMSNAIFEAK